MKPNTQVKMCCIFGQNKRIVTQIFSFNSKRMLYGLKSVSGVDVKLVKVKNFRPMNSTIFKYFVNEWAAYTIVCKLLHIVVAFPL